jgi:hypothetical protein
MRGGLFRSWSGLAVVTLLGACSNIIGISSYEIDPALDDAGGGSTGTGGKNAGGKNNGGNKNMNGGEPNTPVGGDDTGGSGVGGKNVGGKNAGGTGGSNVAGTAAAGEPGMGSAGEPSTAECKTAQDCDDTVDCTVDTCSAAGACVHSPKNNLCDGTLCETCQTGIGCVAGPKTTTQLLLDPGFDTPATGDWDESGSDGNNVVTNNAAQTPTKVAKFGPGPSVGTNLDNQQYSDLLQYLTIPTGTVALSLSGYYKLTTGLHSPKDDYLVTAFYPIDCTDPKADPDCDTLLPFTQFHSFEAAVGASTTWKAFTYSAPKNDVAKMGGVDFTFDLVAHLWDSTFQFDSLQMTATVCQ